MGMGPPPSAFRSVSQSIYALFANEMGLSSLGTHLQVKGVLVGWRTNRRCYIHSDAYRAWISVRNERGASE